jgi:hypothetical protein
VLDDWAPEDVAAFAAYLRRFDIAVEHLSGQPWPHP